MNYISKVMANTWVSGAALKQAMGDGGTAEARAAPSADPTGLAGVPTSGDLPLRQTCGGAF